MAGSKLIKEVYGPLKLFNQKAQKLQNSAFVSQYRETKNALTIRGVKHPEYGTWKIDIDANRASDESIEAVALTLRFFIQNNESCSFANLSALYRQIDPIVHLHNEYEKHRGRLNFFLSQVAQPQPKESEYDRPLLLRDVLEIFVYGGLAHANETKRIMYERWMEEEVARASYTHLFHKIVHEIIALIIHVSRLNNLAISRLKELTRERGARATLLLVKQP